VRTVLRPHHGLSGFEGAAFCLVLEFQPVPKFFVTFAAANPLDLLQRSESLVVMGIKKKRLVPADVPQDVGDRVQVIVDRGARRGNKQRRATPGRWRTTESGGQFVVNGVHQPPIGWGISVEAFHVEPQVAVLHCAQNLCARQSLGGARPLCAGRLTGRGVNRHRRDVDVFVGIVIEQIYQRVVFKQASRSQLVRYLHQATRRQWVIACCCWIVALDIQRFKTLCHFSLPLPAAGATA
jgi:hypothetical protein